MDIPQFYFIRYLISLGMKPKEIIMKLHKMGFEVERDQVDILVNGMMLPKIFENYATEKKVDEKYLLKYAKRFGISDLWRYRLTGKPKETREMYSLIKDMNARLIPVILAIKGEKHIHSCMREIGYEYSQKSIEMMMYYFYNTERISFAGWQDYFKKHVPKAAELLDKPLDYIRYKFGISPKLEYTTILQDLMHLSYFKSKEHLSIDTKDDITIAKQLADLAIKAGEKLEKYSGGDEESFMQDIVLGFENAGIEFKGVDEIDEDDEEGNKQLEII